MGPSACVVTVIKELSTQVTGDQCHAALRAQESLSAWSANILELGRLEGHGRAEHPLAAVSLWASSSPS